MIVTKIEIQELRKTLKEKTKEIETLQSGTNASTVSTVNSNMFIACL